MSKPTSSWVPRLIVGLLVIVVLWLCYFIWTRLEPYEEWVPLGWSQEALRNPYLAAERFVKKYADNVIGSSELSVLDELTDNGTLIIRENNAVLNERRAQQLIEWMEQGGHLVVAAPFLDEDESDVLLSYFDVTKNEVEEELPLSSAQYSNVEQVDFFNPDKDDADEPVDDQKESREERAERIQQEIERSRELVEKQAERAKAEQEILQKERDVPSTVRRLESYLISDNFSRLAFNGIDYTLLADFSGSGSLDHPSFYEDSEDYQGIQSFYWAGNDVAITFMQLDVGDGLLTVMSDINIWNNDQVGLLDHAHLLQILTDGSDQVVFLYGAVVPTLLDLIWKHFREVTIASLLLLVLWIVYSARRFGPIHVVDHLTRRSFKEHIDTMAEYYWKQGLTGELVEGLRSEIKRKVQRLYPDLFRIDDDEKNKRLLEEKLHELTDLPRHTVNNMLMGEVPKDELKFYMCIKLLQRTSQQLNR
ncbi:DUF4350 domain-containing protein [Aurantivibrio plasticivorans]